MKKMTALLLALVLLCACCVSTAGAECRLNKNNVKTALAVVSVAGANAVINTMVKIAQKTSCDDALLVQKATDILAGTVKTAAAKAGVEVGCEYTDYIIDGHEVSIDPLIVINIHNRK